MHKHHLSHKHVVADRVVSSHLQMLLRKVYKTIDLITTRLVRYYVRCRFP